RHRLTMEQPTTTRRAQAARAPPRCAEEGVRPHPLVLLPAWWPLAKPLFFHSCNGRTRGYIPLKRHATFFGAQSFRMQYARYSHEPALYVHPDRVDLLFSG